MSMTLQASGSHARSGAVASGARHTAASAQFSSCEGMKTAVRTCSSAAVGHQVATPMAAQDMTVHSNQFNYNMRTSVEPSKVAEQGSGGKATQEPTVAASETAPMRALCNSVYCSHGTVVAAAAASRRGPIAISPTHVASATRSTASLCRWYLVQTTRHS